MCNPAAAMTGQVGGGLNAAFASYNQGRLQAQGYEYRSMLNQHQADFAELAADEIIASGQAKSRAIKRNADRYAGSQRAFFGGSGAQVNTGTPVDVVADTHRGGAADAAVARRDAIMQAWGYKTKASQERQSSRINDIAEANSSTSGAIAAGSSLLTTAAQTGASYYSFKKEGWGGFFAKK